MTQAKSKIEIYTDGACSQNGTWDGGWAFVIYTDSENIYEEKGYKPNTTNNQMELQAYLSALEYLERNDIFGATIYSDSAYIVNCFKQGWIDNWERNGWKTSKKTDVLNKDYWTKISKLRKKVSHYLVKVKGHSNCVGNIRADYLAVLAAKEKNNENINTMPNR